MIYFISCSLIWGLTWIAIKYQFHAVDSNVAVFYRFIIACALLFIWVLLRKLPLKFSKRDHFNFAAQGLFMFCINYLFSYWASHLAPSALLALASTSIISLNLIGGRLFLNIPMEKQVITGAIISFSGMMLISINELRGSAIHPTSLLGFLIGLAGAASASAGNLISVRNRKLKIPIASNNAWSMLYGSSYTLFFCLLTQRSFVIRHFDQTFILSFLFLTIFGTIITFGAYLKLIELIGPSKAAFTSVVSPVIAVTVSYYFESLALTWLLTLGIIFCLLGNIVALAPKDLLKIKKHAY